MERRRERRAVAAGGHIAAAEIGDHVHLGQLGEQRRVVELPRITALGAMTHRLTVHADRVNLVARQPRGALQFMAAHRVARDERIRRERFPVDFVVTRLLQREQRVAQRLREADERFREHDRRLAGLETHGDAVDAVHAGSRHQPEVDAVGRMGGLRMSLRHVGFSWIERRGPVPRALRPIIRATWRIVKRCTCKLWENPCLCDILPGTDEHRTQFQACFPDHRRSPPRARRHEARRRRTADRGRVRAEARAQRGHRHAAAHQARPRPDRARHPHRPYGRAEQDASAAGSRSYRDLPDRRFHVADRRSVGPQRDASAAHARTDRIEREDLLRTGRARTRPRKKPRSATTANGRCRSARTG